MLAFRSGMTSKDPRPKGLLSMVTLKGSGADGRWWNLSEVWLHRFLVFWDMIIKGPVGPLVLSLPLPLLLPSPPPLPPLSFFVSLGQESVLSGINFRNLSWLCEDSVAAYYKVDTAGSCRGPQATPPQQHISCHSSSLELNFPCFPSCIRREPHSLPSSSIYIGPQLTCPCGI